LGVRPGHSSSAYRDDDWIVARHHCWLGTTDINREERVLTDVVIGSLLRQLEQIVPEATTDLRLAGRPPDSARKAEN